MASTIELLQKLIAHERSSRSIGNTAEAEAFAGRIQKILTEHKLSMSEVEYEVEAHNNPIGAWSMELGTGRADIWRKLLAEGIATCFYCKLIWKEAGKGKKGIKATFIFVGRKSESSLAIEMFKYLAHHGEFIALSHTAKAKDGISGTMAELVSKGVSKAQINRTLGPTLRKWRLDFLLGYAAALYKRLAENRTTLEAEAGSSSCGLILRDEKAIEDFISSRYDIKSGRIRQTEAEFSSAVALGYTTGENISLRESKALPGG